MQSEGPPPTSYRRYDSASRRERYLEGCVLFPIWIVVDAFFRLLRWLHGLLENPIGRRLKGLVLFPVLVGMLLFSRLNPQIIRITEKGEGSLTIDVPRWFLFENAMPSKVRLCAGNGSGELPKKLRGQGVLLRPGQKRKIYLSSKSFYDIEIYGMDGQKLEQMKLRVSIPF